MTMTREETLGKPLPPGEMMEESDNNSDKNNQRSRDVVAYGIILIMATVNFITHIFRINYSDNGTPVFDEKHYAPQAYQMLMNGGLEDNPGFGLVVHPPLGKMMMALGEFFFGYTPLGWRITAIASSVCIMILVSLFIWKTLKNTAALILSGVLMTVEGVLNVTGRIGMLDIFLSLFVTLGFFFIAMDLSKDRVHTPLYYRYWLLLSGLAFGAGMGVKASGVFYPAIAGILFVIVVAVNYRSVMKTVEGLISGLMYYLIAPIAVFALTWVPWIGSENGVSRHGKENFLMSFIQYQKEVTEFHTSLTTSSGHTHPWESKPWEWLIGMKPMLYYTEVTDPTIGSGAGSSKIWLVTNPAVWFLVVPVIVFLAYTAWKLKDKYRALTFVALIMGIVPWLVFYDRTMYLFYTTTIAPFLVIGIVYACYDLSRWLMSKGYSQKVSEWFIMGSYGSLAVLLFALATPWLYSVSVSDDIHHEVESWFPKNETKTTNEGE